MDSDQKSSSPDRPTQSDNALCFSRVSVRRLYGMDLGLDADELCEGINVVYGANASGKTTLARAIRALFWPETVGDDMPIVSGRFTLENATWNVTLEGQSTGVKRTAARPTRRSFRRRLIKADITFILRTSCLPAVRATASPA